MVTKNISMSLAHQESCKEHATLSLERYSYQNSLRTNVKGTSEHPNGHLGFIRKTSCGGSKLHYKQLSTSPEALAFGSETWQAINSEEEDNVVVVLGLCVIFFRHKGDFLDWGTNEKVRT